MDKNQVVNWRSRVVSTGKIKASQIIPHPNNPRRHPQFQRDAVAASFDELGQIAPIIINVQNGYLVDGEDRAWLALAQPEDVEVDVFYVDLTEEEHLKALAVLDATGDLAIYDRERLDNLLREVQSDQPAIQQLLSKLAAEAMLFPEEEREDEDDDNGEFDMSVAWPEIRLQVKPETYDLYNQIMKEMTGKTDAERFAELLTRYSESYA